LKRHCTRRIRAAWETRRLRKIRGVRDSLRSDGTVPSGAASVFFADDGVAERRGR